MRLGEEAVQFLERYGMREDWVVYAAEHAEEVEELGDGRQLLVGRTPHRQKLRIYARNGWIHHFRPVE